MVQFITKEVVQKLPAGHDVDEYRRIYCELADCSGSKKHLKKKIASDAMIVSGLLLANGSIVPKSAFIAPSPTDFSLNSAEAVKIQARGPNGEQLDVASVPFDLTVNLQTEDDEERITLEEVPFFAVLPYDGQTMTVSMSAPNGLPTSFYPQALALETALSLVPDSAFNGSSSSQRAVLGGYIEQFSNLQRSRKIAEATLLLENTIRPWITQNIVYEFEKVSDLNFSGRDLLESVDKIAEKNNLLKDLAPSPAHPFLDVKLDKEHYQAGDMVAARIKVVGKPVNSDNEVLVKSYFSSIEVATSKRSEALWSSKLTAPGDAGEHLWRFQALIQSRRQAAALKAAINSYLQQNLELNRRFLESNDPSEKEEILNKIQLNEKIISDTRERITKGQKPVGVPYDLMIKVE